MTVVNPKSISGINSITMASGSDNLLTIHANDTSEKVRVNSSGDVIVGSGVTLSSDGDGFFTGVCTATTFKGDGSQLSNITSTTINNNADNRVITGSDTANTLNGESALTFNGNNLTLTAASGEARVVVIGGEGEDARISLSADDGDDHIDQYNIESRASDNSFRIDQFSGGSRVDRLSIASEASNGNVTVHTGNLVIGTSGKGIDFSATADGSGTSTSELFSDYEVGTWTPAFSGLSNTPTFAGLQGKYVKVGNIVHISAWMQAGGTNPQFTTTSDPLTITGIPYTANGSGYVNTHGVISWSQWDPWGVSYNETNIGDTTGHIAVGIPDGTNIRFYVSGANNSNRGRVTNNSLHGSGFILEWSMTYQTNS